MFSPASIKPSTKRIVITALVASLFFTLGVALLNKPLLKPEKFWSVVDADQSMFIGYMLKKYDEVNYAKDFSFTVDPNIYQIYNPLELFILHKTFLLFDKNLPVTLYSLVLIFSFIYFFSVFIAMYFFSGSLFAAGFISLFSSVWRYMGFCADVWGMAVVQNARSAYYVLPMLVLSALLVIRTYESGNPKKIFWSFCTVGLVTWMHPVTGYHWVAVCWTIGLIYDFVMHRRYVFLSMLRILGLFVGTLPTIISLIQNKLFGVGNIPAVDVSPHQILEASIAINPTYYCHVMPDLLARFPLPLRAMLVPMFKVIIIAAVILFFYTLIRLPRIAKEQTLSLREHRRWFIVLYVIVSSLFIGFTVLSNPINIFPGEKGLYVSYAICVLGVTFILGANLIRILKSERPSVFDTLLLGIMSFSLLFSIAGSWIINYILAQIDYPQRFFEQMRGIRIAYLVFLIWSASSLTHFLKSVPVRRISFCLVFFFSLLFFSFYAKSVQSNYREVTKEEVNFYEVSDWFRRHTDSNCLTALLIGDPWQHASEQSRFKVLAQRSMIFSYDCYQLVYTNPNAVVPARQRMDDITKASTIPHGIEEYFIQYKPDYVVVSKDQLQLNSLQNIVYQNETYAVVQK